MSNSNNDHSATNKSSLNQLEQALVEYLSAVENGETPDKSEFLQRHPAFSAELSKYIDDHASIQKRLASLQVETAETGAINLPAIGGQANRETASCEPGELIGYFGDYQLDEEIKRGGMGVVFRARQISLNRPVALKMILTGRLASAHDVIRFHTEAESAANLDHPNIVPIYEIGEHQGLHYFSMKLIDGSDLKSCLPDYDLSRSEVESKNRDRVSKVVQLITRVANAVQFAHQHGILHRDLKPANILIDCDGQPHVTDFGLAKAVRAPADFTETGMVVGTPRYMSPEQATGKSKELTAAADVFSMGAIFYELLTGRAAFRSEGMLDAIQEVTRCTPERPRKINPRINRDLETICLKCLQREPGKRYSTAAGFAADLDRWSRGEPIQARRTGKLERSWKWAKRKPAVAFAWALGLLLMVGLVSSAIAESNRILKENAKSQEELWESRLRQVALERNSGRISEATRILQEVAKYRIDDRVKREAVALVTAPKFELVGAYAPYSNFSHDGLPRMWVEFSHDGTYMAFHLSKELSVWNIKTRRRVLQLPAHDIFQFSPTHNVVAYWGLDKKTHVVEVPSGREVCEIIGGFPHFNANGKRLAAGSVFTEIQVTDFSGDVKTLSVEGDPLQFISPKHLVVNGVDGYQIWDIEIDQEVYSADDHFYSVTQPVFRDPARGSVVVNMTLEPRESNFYDLAQQVKLTAKLPPELLKERVDLLHVPISQHLMLAAIQDPTETSSIRFIDLRNGKYAGRVVAPGYISHAMRSGQFSPGRPFFAAYDSNHETVRVWNAVTGELLKTLPGRMQPNWSRDGKLLAVLPTDTSNRGEIEVYRIEDPSPRYFAAGATSHLFVNDDDSKLVTPKSTWTMKHDAGPIHFEQEKSLPPITDKLVWLDRSSGSFWRATGLTSTKRDHAIAALSKKNGTPHPFSLSVGPLRMTKIGGDGREFQVPYNPELDVQTDWIAVDEERQRVVISRQENPYSEDFRGRLMTFDLASGEPMLTSDSRFDVYSTALGFLGDGTLIADKILPSELITADVTNGNVHRRIRFALTKLPLPIQPELSFDRAVVGAKGVLLGTVDTPNISFDFKSRTIAGPPNVLFVALQLGRNSSDTTVAITDTVKAVGLAEGELMGGWDMESNVSCLAIYRDGRFVISGGHDGILRVRDVKQGDLIWEWEGHEGSVTALTLNADESILISSDKSGCFRAWNLAEMREKLKVFGVE